MSKRIKLYYEKNNRGQLIKISEKTPILSALIKVNLDLINQAIKETKDPKIALEEDVFVKLTKELARDNDYPFIQIKASSNYTLFSFVSKPKNIIP